MGGIPLPNYLVAVHGRGQRMARLEVASILLGVLKVHHLLEQNRMALYDGHALDVRVHEEGVWARVGGDCRVMYLSPSLRSK